MTSDIVNIEPHPKFGRRPAKQLIEEKRRDDIYMSWNAIRCRNVEVESSKCVIRLAVMNDFMNFSA